MKNIILHIICCAVLFPACQKGEEDPVISFRSRKARITGEWKVSEAVWQSGDTTKTYNGEMLSIKYDTSERSLSYDLNYTFKREGEYIKETTIIYPANWNGNGLPELEQKTTETGIWNFTGGSGDTKSKEQLLLQITKVEQNVSNTGSNVNTIAYEGQPEGFVYDIKGLKNDELKMEYELHVLMAGSELVRKGNLTLKKTIDLRDFTYLDKI